MSGIIDPLVEGLQALAILVRHGPLDTARFARLTGWQATYAAAVVSILEQEGLIRHVGKPARIAVTARAVALVGDLVPSRALH